MQLQAALQAFLRQLAADGRSPHTIGQYRRHGTSLANWLAATGASSNVAKLSPDTLARFFADDTAKNGCRGGPKKAVSVNAMRDLRLVQNALNHASIVSTTIYAQVDREKLRAAVGS